MKTDLLLILILITEIALGGTFAGLYEQYGKVHWLVLMLVVIIISIATTITLSIILTRRDK